MNTRKAWKVWAARRRFELELADYHENKGHSDLAAINRLTPEQRKVALIWLLGAVPDQVRTSIERARRVS